MINNDLFEEVLIKPAVEGADKLYIVSGYASAAMAFHHIQKLHDNRYDIDVHLIVGMTVQDGLSLSNHRAFQKLMSEDFVGTFECSYVMNTPPVHSKVYAWFSGDEPVSGYIGSANYSQKAFSSRQREIMDACNATAGYNYYNDLVGDTIYCTHQEAEDFVQVYNDMYQRRRRIEATQPDISDPAHAHAPNIQGLESVRVSFINRDGEVSSRSGLNWGHRPEYNRNRNQAYIPLKAQVYNSVFFPEPHQHFTVLTDDGKTLICVRAQQNAKAIETPHNNSLLGEYFRYRLGVPNGHFITMDDLKNYGRTHVDFYKIDEEAYYMDFSVE